MQHKEYWAERFEKLTDAQLNKGAEYYYNLQEQYRQAIANIEKDIAKWYTRYATENGITLTEAKRLLNGRELEEFRMDVKEYIAKGESLDPKWAKQLEAASTKVHVSRLEALKVQMQQQAEMIYSHERDGIDELARKVYTDGYYHTAYEIQKGIGIGFDLMQLDANRIDKLISKPWAADGKNFSQRIWNNRAQLVSELENRLTQSIIRGQSPKKVIAEIAERFNVNKSRAGALVMTESAFFAAASQRDAFNDLDVEKYEILATLDSRTSETCRRMDGQVIPMSEYKPGVTAPPFHVRCRSTTVPFFDDEFAVLDKRAARDENGKYYTVPASMKYKDWENAFVKKDKNMEEWRKNHILPPIATDDIIGVKAKLPFSVSDAATGANPNYSKSNAYKVNCQRCVVAYELRRRGYDFIAKPKPSRNNIVQWGSECFVDKQGKPVSYFLGLTENALKTELNTAPDGARYSVYIAWKRARTAHVFIAEKVNGVVKFVDPQTGAQDVSNYFANGKNGMFGFMRMDDKDIISDDTIIKATVEVKP